MPSELKEQILKLAKSVRVRDQFNDDEVGALIDFYHQLNLELSKKTYRTFKKRPRSFEVFENESVVFSKQYMIDCLPTLQSLLFSYFDRKDELTFLDVGTNSGAGASLLADLHKEHTLWSKLSVDALEKLPFRKNYAKLNYPRINYMVSDVFDIVDKKWDITFCSHTIEHFSDPSILIQRVLEITKYFAIFYAPYSEGTLGSGHRSRIDETTFEGFDILVKQVKPSLAFKPKTDRCILVVLQTDSASKNLAAKQRLGSSA